MRTNREESFALMYAAYMQKVKRTIHQSSVHYNDTLDELNWLLFIATVPGKSTTPRIRLWRSLKGLGAVVLRDGVYLLPHDDALVSALNTLVQDVQTLEGTAYSFKVATQPGESSGELVRLFDRTDEYAEFIASAIGLREELKSLAEPALRKKLAQLKREFEGLSAVDFFPGPSKSQAEQALSETTDAINDRFSPGEPRSVIQEIEKRAPADYQNRIWATRSKLWVDRVASAWLIRRFIDREAAFLWLRTPADCPDDALGFDFDGAAFSHVGQKVTFEVLLTAFSLDGDAALRKLGALVHYLDVGGVPVPEADGFESILTGIREDSRDDDDLLLTMTPVLNALYTAFARAGEDT